MKSHTELNDVEFEYQFSTCVLDPEVFTHDAHLRLAWIHIHRYGVDRAIENITTQLQRYVESLGVKEKYHHTVTIAAIRAVYHFMIKSKTTDFTSFISENRRLRDNFRELLAAHYSTDLFRSPLARKEFLQPELLPFDQVDAESLRARRL